MYDLIFSLPASNAKEAEVERFYEDLQDLLELIATLDYSYCFYDSISLIALNLIQD